MLEENKVINGLWIGDELSPIELLTLHAAIRQGHSFHLWVYNDLKNKLPKGVSLLDANDIIPVKEVYAKQSKDPTNQLGANSFGAPFSDLFRYKLLYEKGGWWIDMDVTLFKALDFNTPYFFRAHPLLPMIGNVMKCPPKSDLMLAAYEETQLTCNEQTIDWLLPNRILNKYVAQFGLNNFIKNNLSNQDNWMEVLGLIYQNGTIPDHWYCFHWMNEEWRSQEIAKNKIYYKSTLAKLMDQYQISYQPIKFIHQRYPWLLKKTFRSSMFYPVYRKLKYGKALV